MYLKLKFALFLIVFSSVGFTQNIITFTDNDILPGDTVTWTSDNIYLLDGFVFVEEGSVLNIEEGTVIKGKETPSSDDNASALIIARGGKIYAEGSAENPIIFTAENDDLSNPDDLTTADRGLWGGVILLGKAEINTTSGAGQIEGIPSDEARGAYGGGDTPDNEDNSGVMRFVSIRHGGAEIGAGNEINGLTFGAAGSGTVIEHIEVFANLDDGYEWFGGTVNTKYLVSAFCGDDGFDFDEGWTGKNQFWFALMGDDFAGRIAEQDGGTTPEDGMPYAIPEIYNATFIGSGSTAAPQGDGSEALIFRDNAGGKYYNSIITDYNGGGGGAAIIVEDLESGEDSRARLENGDLIFSNNIFWQFGDGNDPENLFPQDFVRDHFTVNNNSIVDPELNNISRNNDGNLDPRPNAEGLAASGAVTSDDDFFASVEYYGAFNPDEPLWINGWTALSQNNITEVNEDKISGNLPGEFSLAQNYPNPFNPTTKISWKSSVSSWQSLKVFDVLGNEVTTLINEFRTPGTYEVIFDAAGLSSGVYIYKLETDNKILSKKMILMK